VNRVKLKFLPSKYYLNYTKISKGVINGTVTMHEASDYYTKEEMVPFKKAKKGNKNKKRRIRSKPISEQLLPLDAEAENPETDLGSRNQRENRQRSKKLAEVVSALEKRDSYNKAVEKAEADSKWLFEEEEDEDELYKSLTRKLAQREPKKREEIIAEEVEKAVQDKREAKKKDTRLTFNTTTEFIRSIPKAPPGDSSESEEVVMDVVPEDKDEETTNTIETIRKKQKERFHKNRTKNDEMDVETDNDQSEVKDTVVKEKSSEMVIEPIEELMGAEPLASNGVAATLKLLKSRGTSAISMESMTGRASDKKVDEVNADHDTFRLDYLDERGRAMTPKEAFRRLSYRFHGKAPGKNKDEKRIKREDQDLRRKMMSTTDTPLGTLSAIQRTQQQSKLPYVIMGGKTVAQKTPLFTSISTTETELQQGAKGGAGTFREIPIEKVQPLRPKKEEVKKEKVSFGFKQ